MNAENTTEKNTKLSVKTLSIIIIPMIVFYGSVGLFLPPYFANSYVIGYVLSLTIIALILGIRFYSLDYSMENKHALRGFLIAHMLFWAGGISWMVSLQHGLQEGLLVANILIISAYLTFVYICLEPLTDQLQKLSKHKIFQVFSGNMVLYILFSTPLFYDVLTSKRTLLDELIYLVHPVMDIVIFTLVLLIIILYFRSKVRYHWLWICMTFLLMIAGDLFYTYYAILGIPFLSQLAGVFYNVAYGLLVFGLLMISRNNNQIRQTSSTRIERAT